MTARQWNLLTNTEKSLSRRAVSLIKLNVQNKVLFKMLDLFVFRWPSMDEDWRGAAFWDISGGGRRIIWTFSFRVLPRIDFFIKKCIPNKYNYFKLFFRLSQQKQSIASQKEAIWVMGNTDSLHCPRSQHYTRNETIEYTRFNKFLQEAYSSLIIIYKATLVRIAYKCFLHDRHENTLQMYLARLSWE